MRTVDVGEQRLGRRRDHVDHVGFQRLLGADADSVGHERLGHVGVAAFSSAIARIEAAASFTALSDPTAPSIPTGVAAPTFVPGAIAAMSATEHERPGRGGARPKARRIRERERAFRVACVI